MEIEEAYRLWAEDAEVLAQVGRVLHGQPTRLTVRLPKSLADQALASWRRDIETVSLPESETPEQRTARHRAGILGLIGLSIEKNGAVSDADDVTVEVDAWFVGLALETADEVGLLHDSRPSE